jgi:hypothetical protein
MTFNRVFSGILFQWFWAVYLTLLFGTGLVSLAGWFPFYGPVQDQRFYLWSLLLLFRAIPDSISSYSNPSEGLDPILPRLLDAHILSLDQMARAVSLLSSGNYCSTMPALSNTKLDHTVEMDHTVTQNHTVQMDHTVW